MYGESDPAGQESAVIPQVTVLHGHDSQHTAYIIENYPYGRLRCQKRVWVDGPPDKGQYKGQYRPGSQTSNPKRGNDWGNKPKYGNYHLWVFMYLDGIDHDGKGTQHVEFHQINAPEPAQDALMRADGTIAQLPEDQRREYELLAAYSRKRYSDPWDKWDKVMAYLSGYVATHGDVPTKEEATAAVGYIYDYTTACEVTKHNAGI